MYPTPRTWRRIRQQYGELVPLGTHLAMLAACTATMPFALWERLRYGQPSEPLAQPPLFIIGHWRSGTTMLHRTLAADRQWAYMDNWEAYAPHFYRSTRWLRPLLEGATPEDRGIDSMEASLHFPAEDETALARLTPHTYSTKWLFPATASMRDTVFLDGLSEAERQAWLATYQSILRKLSAHKAGRLLLKNPAHTGRIKLLLGLYPGAQFIHIHRHPEQVFRSMRAYYLNSEKLDANIEQVPTERLEAIIVADYAQLMARYLAERDLLGPGQLIEMGYAETVAKPVATAERIYKGLNLQGWPKAEGYISAYVQSVAGYKPSSHPPLEAGTRAMLREHLAHVYAEWYPDGV